MSPQANFLSIFIILFSVMFLLSALSLIFSKDREKLPVGNAVIMIFVLSLLLYAGIFFYLRSDKI